MYAVVEATGRLSGPGGQRYSARCPEPGCHEWATHKIKLGHRFVGRYCEAHATAYCQTLNGALAFDPQVRAG